MSITKQTLIILGIMVGAALIGAARMADENWLNFTRWAALFMAIQMPGLWLLVRESRRLG